ncbi:uncharacterized protein LOC111627543 [Centruroides sculpturatus]|uniref:uncharacterized protein LOC111627543 n=1 Tax=Centruroides sculpturatus TaxID=218467 RepID=UPI000C6E6A99|nr:uncharacterized protein LOC111627543 [Centruroides sculpturatus]
MKSIRKLDDSMNGRILVDELKLSEHFHMASSSDIEGFVDLDDYTLENMKTAASDHGMVMYQTLTGNWQQIVGVFPHMKIYLVKISKYNRELLSIILLKAVALLERFGLMVDFITCDGTTWNRNMWSQFGIGYKSLSKQYQVKKIRKELCLPFLFSHFCIWVVICNILPFNPQLEHICSTSETSILLDVIFLTK